MNCSKRRWSAFSSPTKALVRFSEGPKNLAGFVGVLAATRVEGRLALDEVGEAAAHPLGEAVEEQVEVGGRRRFGEAERGAVLERRVVVGAGADRDVVVGDSGERGGADDRGRALVQFLFDRDLHFGEVVVGQLDAFDRAHGLAADLDLVVGHELAGVLEEQVVLVAAVAAEEDHPEDDHDHREGSDDGDADRRGPPTLRRAFLLASCVSSHGSSLAAPLASDPREQRQNRIRAIPLQAAAERVLNWKSTRYFRA